MYSPSDENLKKEYRIFLVKIKKNASKRHIGAK